MKAVVFFANFLTFFDIFVKLSVNSFLCVLQVEMHFPNFIRLLGLCRQKTLSESNKKNEDSAKTLSSKELHQQIRCQSAA